MTLENIFQNLIHFIPHTLRILLFLGVISLQAMGAEMPRKFYFSPNYLSSSEFSSTDLSVDDVPFLGLDTLFSRKNYGIYLIQKEATWIAWQDCGFDLFVLKEGQWRNFYNFKNFGYTCGSKILFREDKIYLLGGKDIFIHQSDLLEFMYSSGSWELRPVPSQPLNYGSQWTGVREDGAFQLMGHFFSERNKLLDEPVSDGFFLDFKENTWKKIKLDWEVGKNIPYREKSEYVTFDLEDYSLSLMNEGWYVLDKKSLQLFSLPAASIPLNRNPDYFQLHGNSLYFKLLNFPRQHIDLTNLLKKAILVAKIKIEPIQKESSDGIQIVNQVIIFCCCISLAVLAFLFIKKNKKKEIPQIDQGSEVIFIAQQKLATQGQILQQLKNAGNRTYTIEEFDQLLNLSTKNHNNETNRIHRSRTITRINDWSTAQWGKPLIQRKRLQEDRRFFYYKIEFPNLAPDTENSNPLN